MIPWTVPVAVVYISLENSNDSLDTRVWNLGPVKLLCRGWVIWPGVQLSRTCPHGDCHVAPGVLKTVTLTETNREKTVASCTLAPSTSLCKGQYLTLMFLRYIYSARLGRMCICKRIREKVACQWLSVLLLPHMDSFRGRSSLSLLSYQQRCGSQDVANWVFRKPVTRS